MTILSKKEIEPSLWLVEIETQQENPTPEEKLKICEEAISEIGIEDFLMADFKISEKNKGILKIITIPKIKIKDWGNSKISYIKNPLDLENKIFDHLLTCIDQSEVPEILIKYELEKIIDDFKHTIKRGGNSVDNFSQITGKTQDEIMKEFHPSAQRLAAVSIVIRSIAKENGINVSETDIEEYKNNLKDSSLDPVIGDDLSTESFNTYARNTILLKKTINFIARRIVENYQT